MMKLENKVRPPPQNEKEREEFRQEFELKHRANLNKFFEAVEKNDLPTADLYRSYAPFKTANNDGIDALEVAIKIKSNKMIAFLLENNWIENSLWLAIQNQTALPNSPDPIDFGIAFWYVSRIGDTLMIDNCLGHRFRSKLDNLVKIPPQETIPNGHLHEPFLEALLSGNFERANQLVNKMDLNDQFGPNNSSYLIEAVRFGKVHAMFYLLANGIYIDLVDELGNTAVHYAKSFEMVNYLMQNGAYPNPKNKAGETPLSIALNTEPPPELKRYHAGIIKCLYGNLRWAVSDEWHGRKKEDIKKELKDWEIALEKDERTKGITEMCLIQ